MGNYQNQPTTKRCMEDKIIIEIVKKKAAFITCIILCLTMTLLMGCGSNKKANNPKDNIPNSGTAENNDEDLFIERKVTDDYIYSVYTHHIELHYCYIKENADETYVFPDEIEGLPVTKISPEHYGTSVGSGVFRNHEDIQTDDYYASIKTVIIPDTVTYIGESSFGNYENIENIIIPDSVKQIEGFTFWGTKWYENLTDEFVIVGDGVLIKYNGDNEEMVIPNGVKYISSCGVSRENRDTVPTKRIIIPDTVEEISAGAFTGPSFSTPTVYKCYQIEEVVIPDSVKKIGRETIESNWVNSSDEFIIVGDGVLIGYNLQNDVEELIIPDTVKSISFMVNRGDESAKINKLIIPDSVKTISKYAFSSVPNIDTIILQGDINEFSYSFCGCGCKEIILEGDIKQINNYSFSACEYLQSITITGSVTQIGQHAFSNCPSLQNVIFSSNTIFIAENTFAYCTSLKNITLPENINCIGNGVFRGCRNLESIVIPLSVTSIGEDVFVDDREGNLQNLTIFGIKGSEAEKYANEHDIPFTELTEEN